MPCLPISPPASTFDMAIGKDSNLHALRRLVEEEVTLPYATEHLTGLAEIKSATVALSPAPVDMLRNRTVTRLSS